MDIQNNGLATRPGIRKRGRQRRRRRDDIRVYEGATWTIIEINRNEWSLHEEGYILHWMNTAYMMIMMRIGPLCRHLSSIYKKYITNQRKVVFKGTGHVWQIVKDQYILNWCIPTGA